MKAIVCEMCGNNDLVKRDGLFVCQSCGTKYSLEEARKLLVDGVVNIEGTVKVDNTASIENYLRMAKNALESKNYKEAEDYSNRVIEIDANNYVAWYQKGLSAGWQSTLANVRLNETVNCFSHCIDNMPEDSDFKDHIIKASYNLVEATMQLACNHFSEFPSSDTASTVLSTYSQIIESSVGLIDKCGASIHNVYTRLGRIMHDTSVNTYMHKILPEYKGDGHPTKYEWEKYIDAGNSVITLIETSIKASNENPKAIIGRYKNLIAIENDLINSYSYKYEVNQYGGYYVKDYSLTVDAKNLRINKIMQWHQCIKNLDPSYQIPPRPNMPKSGCYIATSVYGSYDCPQVWVLRRYRDYDLANSVLGRLFIKTYYATSPTIVKLFGESTWFKKIWKTRLDSMVDTLKQRGYDDTPYEDKIW